MDANEIEGTWGPDESRFTSEIPGVTDRIEPLLIPLKDDADLTGIWFRVDYDPISGTLSMTRPMRVRRDIPGAEAFQRFLDILIAAAGENRAAQAPEVASA